MSASKWMHLSPLVLSMACALNPAPSGFLPSAKDAQTSGYGAWVEATISRQSADSIVAGELIAVSNDSLWILPDAGRVTVLPARTIHGGTLMWYTSDAGKVALWALLGTAATASNGFLLIFTAPVWILTGVIGSIVESYAPSEGLPPHSWSGLQMYARFPQGLPPGIDLAGIRSKPRGQPGTTPVRDPE